MEKLKPETETERKVSEVSYNILETIPFLTDFLKEIETARNRVWIQTMALEPGHFTDILVQKLVEAQQRGVDVKIVYDGYSDYVTANTFNHVPLLKKEDREYKKNILHRKNDLVLLLKKYCQVFQTNIPSDVLRNTPFPAVIGRDHKKISIVDDVAYMGGINLTPLDTQRIDFMLKADNQNLLYVLSTIFLRSFSDEEVSDTILDCDDHNAVLVDSGQRSKSIILQHASDAIDQEKENITLVSPYLPSGKLRRKLNESTERGVTVEVITSQKSQLGLTAKISQRVHNMGQVKPLFRITRLPAILHAKALLLGNHSAIIGSHNFDEFFVNLGTEEVALHTSQTEIVTQLEALFNRMRSMV